MLENTKDSKPLIQTAVISIPRIINSNNIKMTLKNNFLTAHSISGGIGMNEKQAIQCVRIADVHAISFYNWMQDNYYQVGDGFVRDRNIDETKRITITIDNAMNRYQKENDI